MQTHAYVAIVTLVSLLVFVWMMMGVGAARRKSGIQAPTMTGDPGLERAIRIHLNTLEWLPIFLPSLWLCHIFWQPQDQSGIIVSAIGVVWIVGRILYALGYAKDPSRRELGFMVQLVATAILLFGALGKAVAVLITG